MYGNDPNRADGRGVGGETADETTKKLVDFGGFFGGCLEGKSVIFCDESHWSFGETKY